MICFWLNDAFSLSPEKDEERSALLTIYKSLRAGLNPDPYGGRGGSSGEILKTKDPKNPKDLL